MQFFVEGVIYFYVFICMTLMLFNILYIARSKWVERVHERQARYWGDEIKQAEESEGKFVISPDDLKRLKHVQNFSSFHKAVVYWVLGTEGADNFFVNNAHQIQELAIAYARRDAMERAFMASFIASFRCPLSPNAGMLAEIMLSYLDDSTVFCRENVLQALYALGRPGAVENALQLMNERKWYHSPKLLSDGLTMYTGNREELVELLWRNHTQWDESFNVAVVQFGAFLDSERIQSMFLDALLHEDVTVEVRFGLIRYFQRHPIPDALERLIAYVEEDGQYAIPAASALAGYDNQRTRAALKQALCSKNWYVRHNAALSLVRMGLSEEERADVVRKGDRYAIEMLDFVLGPQAQGGAA